MVSGVGWPDGDPFLQRQNEPSLAVSTRNPLHLLGGANDYRTVDLPGLAGSGTTGDAWLGVFKSRDGGATWTSNLIPGYPQDRSSSGTASPLKSAGYQAAADPVVRAGPNGMFYYSGIAFQRSNEGLGAVFVARYIDNNNTEKADPVQYLGTTVVDRGNPGGTNTPSVFIDKPWLAVDIPRTGALNCTVGDSVTPFQSFPGGNLYLGYTEFVGDDHHGKIMFARSRDCGVTWGTPIPITDSSAANQGSVVAVDPNSGAVYVVWRRFQVGTTVNALYFVKSTDGGQTFSAPVTIANGAPAAGQNPFSPFDQATTIVDSRGTVLDARFRTNAYPTIAVDGNSRIYVAWSQMGAGPGGDARIVYTTSTTGTTWSSLSTVDNQPTRGHQIMPASAFAGGKLTYIYYDLRDTQTTGNFTKAGPSAYNEARVPIGDRANGGDARVFSGEVSDSYAGPNGARVQLQRRQTMDVHVAQANVAGLLFGTARVSQYIFGSRPPVTNQTTQIIEQLQTNPPNLPMFALGTVPFMGDYLDVTALAFVVDATGKWVFNTAADPGVVFHAVWTDNRDVRPPPLGTPWSAYTPPSVALNLAKQFEQLRHPSPVEVAANDKPAEPVARPGPGAPEDRIRAASLADPSQQRPVCVAGATGMRNQNIYTARISQGLVAYAPGNSKALSSTISRAFVVTAQNTSTVQKIFRLSIGNQPANGRATFAQPGKQTVGLLLRLDTTVAPGETAARSVFIASMTTTASVRVDITEVAAVNGLPVAGGLKTSVYLNQDPTNPANPDISNREIYNPDISNPDISNPDISNPDISNPDISNRGISNPDISNPGISNKSVANPDISNPDISNPDISNPDISNPDISNPDISNPDISNSSIQDVVWKVTNNGNTYASYSLKVLTSGPAVPPGVKKQLVVYKVYGTPEPDGCSLAYSAQTQILLNLVNPVFSQQSDIANPNISDSSVTNATITLAPGETANVDLRIVIPLTVTNFQPARTFVGAITAHAANTDDVTAGITTPKVAASQVEIVTNALASGLTGTAYSAALVSAGGTGTVRWTIVPTAGQQLPAGIALTLAGALQGTLGAAATYTFTVLATDSGTPVQTATQTFSIVVTAPPALAIVSPATLPTGYVGFAYLQTLAAGGGLGTKTWSLAPLSSLPAALLLNPATGVISGTPGAVGTFNFTVAVTDASPTPQVVTKAISLTITPITLLFTLQPVDALIPALSPAKVKAQDALGNALAGVSITVGLVSSAVTLSGTKTASTGSDGLANFPNLSVGTVGPYQLQASANGATAGLSRVFTITSTGTGGAGAISSYAGNGAASFGGDGGAATSASLDPASVAMDSAGNLYVSDYANNRIRKVNPLGTISTYAGTGAATNSGDGGLAVNAAITSATAVATDAAGNLYLAGPLGGVVRKVAALTRQITTIAGQGCSGGLGDGGPATQACIGPHGLAVDSAGNLYIAETTLNRVRRVDANGIITTWAGTGTAGYNGDGIAASSAQLNFPYALAVDSARNLYIADHNNHRVRRVTPGGVITTIAGNGGSQQTGDGGPAVNAQLFSPTNVAVDAAGNVYITDLLEVRKVDVNGIITTVAGSQSGGYSGDGGPASLATFGFPVAVATDASGNLYIADHIASRVRKVAGSGALTPASRLTITTVTLPPATAGVFYQYTGITAAGGSGARSWTASGLPTGLSMEGSTGRIFGTPDASGIGTAAPRINVTDTTGTTGGFAALAVFGPPVANNDTYVANGSQSLVVAAPGVLSNDTDPAGHPLNTVVVSSTTHGSLTLNANGGFNYNPIAGFQGTDTFTYNANNGVRDSGPNFATVTIHVCPCSSGPGSTGFTGPYSLSNFSASGSNGGNTSITPTGPPSTSAAFAYNINLGNPGPGVPLSKWTFQATAATTGKLSFNYHYTGNHSYFQITAFLQAFAGAAGGTTTITPYSAGPAYGGTSPSGGFDVSGAATINITQGYPFGFIVGGSNYDYISLMNGTLTITNFVVTPAPYTYALVSVGDTVGGIPLGTLGEPALNNNGSLAYRAYPAASGTPILIKDGAVLVPGAATIGGHNISNIASDVSINNSGAVAFVAAYSDPSNASGNAVFTQNALLAKEGDKIAGQTLVLLPPNRPSINDQGTTAFMAYLDTGQANSGIFTQQGMLVRNGSVIGGQTITGFTNEYVLNAAGTLAFLGSITSGKGIFTQSSVLALDQSRTTIGGQTIVGVGSHISENAKGTVAFPALGNSLGASIYSQTSILAKNLDTSGSYTVHQAEDGGVSINSGGITAYTALVTTSGPDLEGIFTAFAPVVVAGQVISGHTISHFGAPHVNDSGQVAVHVYYTEGSDGILLATPIYN